MYTRLKRKEIGDFSEKGGGENKGKVSEVEIGARDISGQERKREENNGLP